MSHFCFCLDLIAPLKRTPIFSVSGDPLAVSYYVSSNYTLSLVPTDASLIFSSAFGTDPSPFRPVSCIISNGSAFKLPPTKIVPGAFNGDVSYCEGSLYAYFAQVGSSTQYYCLNDVYLWYCGGIGNFTLSAVVQMPNVGPKLAKLMAQKKARAPKGTANLHHFNSLEVVEYNWVTLSDVYAYLASLSAQLNAIQLTLDYPAPTTSPMPPDMLSAFHATMQSISASSNATILAISTRLSTVESDLSSQLGAFSSIVSGLYDSHNATQSLVSSVHQHLLGITPPPFSATPSPTTAAPRPAPVRPVCHQYLFHSGGVLCIIFGQGGISVVRLSGDTIPTATSLPIAAADEFAGVDATGFNLQCIRQPSFRFDNSMHEYTAVKAYPWATYSRLGDSTLYQFRVSGTQIHLLVFASPDPLLHTTKLRVLFPCQDHTRSALVALTCSAISWYYSCAFDLSSMITCDSG